MPHVINLNSIIVFCFYNENFLVLDISEWRARLTSYLFDLLHLHLKVMLSYGLHQSSVLRLDLTTYMISWLWSSLLTVTFSAGNSFQRRAQGKRTHVYKINKSQGWHWNWNKAYKMEWLEQTKKTTRRHGDWLSCMYYYCWWSRC